MDRGELKCRISKGMFSDERVIEVTLRGGLTLSVIVQASNVAKQDAAGNGVVTVDLCSVGNEPWAILPTPSRKVVPVQRADVVMAP